MTSAEAVERVMRLIAPFLPKGKTVQLRTAIQVLVNDGLTELARSNPRNTLLRRTFDPETATAGVVDLAPLTVLDEPMLLDLIADAEIYAAGITRKLQYLPDRSALDLDRPSGFGYCTLVDTDLHIKGLTSTAYAGAVTVTGTFVPSWDSLVTPLDEMLVQIVVKMVKDAGYVAKPE